MPNFVDKNRALSNSANNFRAQPSIYDQGSSGGYNFLQAAQGRSGSQHYSNPSFSSGQSRMTAQQQSYGGYGGYGSNKGQTNQLSYGTPQISYPKSSSNYAGSAPKLPVYPGLEQPANSSPLGTIMKAIATTSTTTSTTKTPAQVQLDLNAQKYPDSSTGSDFQDQMMQYMQAMEQYMQFYNPQMFEQQKQTNQASNAMALSKPSSSGGQYGISQRVGAASGPTNIQQIRLVKNNKEKRLILR